MKFMSVNLDSDYGGTVEASSFLNSTSQRLDARAANIKRQARKNRHLINLGLKIVYIVTTSIISLTLVAAIALSGVCIPCSWSLSVNSLFLMIGKKSLNSCQAIKNTYKLIFFFTPKLLNFKIIIKNTQNLTNSIVHVSRHVRRHVSSYGQILDIFHNYLKVQWFWCKENSLYVFW